MSFNLMAAVTICSDFGTPKNKAWHSFHCFSIYLPGNDVQDAMIFVEVETPILWPPDVKSELIGKDPVSWKD